MKIDYIGFSAGAHLLLNATINFEAEPEWIDEIDDVSAQPNFIAPIYSSRLSGVPNYEIFDYAKCPPTFIAVGSADDFGLYTASLAMYEYFSEKGVPTELNVFKGAVHGFGLGNAIDGSDQWPELFITFLESQGIIESE